MVGLPAIQVLLLNIQAAIALSKSGHRDAHALSARGIPIPKVGGDVGDTGGVASTGESTGTSGVHPYDTDGEGEGTSTYGTSSDGEGSTGGTSIGGTGIGRPPAIGSTSSDENGVEWPEVIEQGVDAVKEVIENILDQDSSQTSLATALPTDSRAVSEMIVASTAQQYSSFPTSAMPTGIDSSGRAWLTSAYQAEIRTAQAVAATMTPRPVRSTSSYSYPTAQMTGGAVRLRDGARGAGLALVLAYAVCGW